MKCDLYFVDTTSSYPGGGRALLPVVNETEASLVDGDRAGVRPVERFSTMGEALLALGNESVRFVEIKTRASSGWASGRATRFRLKETWDPWLNAFVCTVCPRRLEGIPVLLWNLVEALPF